MPVSGQTVFRELQQSLDTVRAESAALRGEWERLDRQVTDLVEQRGSVLLELARHYLPDLSHETIAGTLEGIREQLQQVLERKERRQVELSGQLSRLVADRSQLEGELSGITEQLNVKVRTREELEQRVAAALAADAEFQRLTRAALAAEGELKRNEERAQELRREADDKLPAYERSRLFQYLNERRFATPEYAVRGLTRRLDRWVARLIDYERSRRSYEFLTRVPALIEEEIRRRRADFEAQMNQVEALQRQLSDSLGLTALLAEGERLGERRDALVGRLDVQKQRCQQTEEELLTLQQSQGRFYEEALARLRSFLAAAESSLLERHARQTTDPADDEIVSRVQWLSAEIDRFSPELSQLSAACQRMEERVSGVDFVVRRFQQANFDAERSYFEEGFEAGILMERFRTGVMGRDELWQSIRNGQKFEPTWVEQQAAGAAEVLNSPFAHVLMHAMVEVAGAALQSAATRSVERRWPSSPRSSGGARRMSVPHVPRMSRPGPSLPRSAPRGFTSGRGF
jgi:chromosome segregation ATPase